MEDSLHNTGSSGGLVQNMSTKNLLLVFSGIFLFVALMSGLYLSTQTQNVAPKAQVPESCQGENVYVSGDCGGDAIVGSIPASGLAGDPGSSAPQLCCQRQSAPPAEPPKEEPTAAPVPPTEAPASTEAPVAPTDSPSSPIPTDVPVADQPAPTEAPAPTSGPSCRQAPDFDVEIIINECPGCLGATTQ